MKMAQKRDFTVKVAKEETVKPAIPAAAKHHWLPLTNLDLIFPPLDFAFFFCYHNVKNLGIMSFGSKLKTALSETLVSYYPLAGEIVENQVGEPELLCNDGGVGFVEAYADVELRWLDLYKADESVRRFVPRKKHGVLAIQATRMKCGSVAVACVFDHRVVDAYSANMFITSWAESARTKTTSVTPTLRPSLLNPRLPTQTNKPMPVICPRLPMEHLQSPDHNGRNRLEGRTYYIKAGKIDNLQSLCCSSNGCHNTKLEAFTAFIWKLVAKSYEEDDTAESHIGIMVDGRRKLNPSQMETYFGNVVSCPFNGQKVKDLVRNPLPWVANEIHQVIEQAATKDHFMDLIDQVQNHRPQPIILTMQRMDGTRLVVSSGLKVQVPTVDFGWGSPVLGLCYLKEARIVMPFPAANADGDWVVFINLQKRQLDVIEEEAPDVFVPLSSHHFLPRARY